MTMAVDSSSSCQKQHQIQEFLEGNGNVPVGCSCLKLNKPNVHDLNSQLPLDMPPILVEETSFPDGLHGSQEDSVMESKQGLLPIAPYLSILTVLIRMVLLYDSRMLLWTRAQPQSHSKELNGV